MPIASNFQSSQVHANSLGVHTKGGVSKGLHLGRLFLENIGLERKCLTVTDTLAYNTTVNEC